MIEDTFQKNCKHFSDLPGLIDERNDPNVLFKNNWLMRGGAAALVASSGVGKSSMLMQMAYNWTLGKPFLVEPLRPLTIAICQTEDSERDVAEQIDGMRRGLREIAGWTDDELELAEQRLMSWDCCGVCGDNFADYLYEMQKRNFADLVLLNPIQAVFGGDVSDQESVTHWCREKIDPIIKGKMEGVGEFAILSAMHTAKQSASPNGRRDSLNQNSEYLMSGSHEWTDWLRASIGFLPIAGSDTYFQIHASKRGGRAAWKTPDGQRTRDKVFKHSNGFIYWQEVTSAEEMAAIGTTSKAATIATHKSLDEGIEKNTMHLVNLLRDACRNKKPMTNEDLRKYALERWGSRKGNETVTKVWQNLFFWDIHVNEKGQAIETKFEPDEELL